MPGYLIMRNPGHNRVYYDQADKLALAELKLAALRFQQTCSDIKVLDLEGVGYLHFSVPMALGAEEVAIVSRLSFIYALFQMAGEEQDPLLRPQALLKPEYLDPKLSILLKYSGKTNELFTRMMINVALLSSAFTAADRIQLLDPVAGKGTTLFEGAIYGYDVTGVEIERQFVHEAFIYFKKFLELEKYKHAITRNQMYAGENGKDAYIQLFEYARTKEEFKEEADRKVLALIAGNALHTGRFFKKERFHLIVGDLPYGVSHGNVTRKKHASPTRNPLELIQECLADWHKVLKVGGVLVLAWNTFVLPRQDLVKAVETKGFKVLKSSPYDEFTHRVDQSIKRDILVARKEAEPIKN